MTARKRAPFPEDAATVTDGRSQRPPQLRVVGDLQDLPDEELMLRHGAGEAGAFDLLVTRHKGRVFGLLRRMGVPADRAEELLADVFLKLHRAAPRYVVTAKFTTYLHTVTWRAAVNAQARARHQLDRGVAEPGMLDRAAPSAGAHHPEQALTTRRAFDRLDAELAELPAGHRDAFVLYYAEGMSCADIAELLSTTPADVKGRLAYARKLLRSRMAPWLQERNG